MNKMKIDNFDEMCLEYFLLNDADIKKKVIIKTDVFKEGLILEKVLKGCALLYLGNYDYKNKPVNDGSMQVIFFPVTKKELTKRCKALEECIKKKAI